MTTIEIKPKFKTPQKTINRETIKGEVKQETPQAAKHESVLPELLKEIRQFNFIDTVYPKAKELRKRLERLDPESPERNETLKELNGLKLESKHLYVLAVENLLSIAIENEWGICKNGDFVYLFNGQYWKAIDKEMFAAFLGNAAEKMGVEKYLSRYFKFRENIFKQFLTTAYLPSPEPDPGKVCINMLNGTFEITQANQKLRPFDRNDFLTHQLPFEYNPKAEAPKFKKYIDKVLPDKAKQKVLAEYIGSIFIRNGTGIKLEKCLLMFGSGSNGKSVLFEILMALLGSDNVSNFSLESLCNNTGYYRAEIAGKLLNYSSEINNRMQTAIFKQIVSGEPIEARSPYGKPFQITQYAKLMFNANELPRDVEHSEAFFRRFLIIEFDVTIPEKEQNKSLHKEIIDFELSGVFNWVLDGLKRILEQKTFTQSDAIDRAIKDYKKQSDTVSVFLDESEYSKSAKQKTTLKSLYTEYREYCNESGFKSMNKQNFRKRLEGAGITVLRENDGNNVYVSKTPF